MYQLDTEITGHQRVSRNFYKLTLSAPRIARIARPGQFIHLWVTNEYNPLLRRPFSIQRVKNTSLQILYKVVGKGTEILSKKIPGDKINIIGPLGNGYSLPQSNCQNILLVAGGTGVASLLFLAEFLIRQQIVEASRFHRGVRPTGTTFTPTHRRGRAPSPTVFLGAKTKSEILCVADFRKLRCKVKIATEDGSLGYKGMVTDLLQSSLISARRFALAGGGHQSSVNFHRLPVTGYRLPIIYACGPRPLLKEVARISSRYKIPGQVSLEEHMACGVGACRGCVVKIRNPKSKIKKFVYKRVCRDGPVFNAEEIVWE